MQGMSGKTNGKKEISLRPKGYLCIIQMDQRDQCTNASVHIKPRRIIASLFLMFSLCNQTLFDTKGIIYIT